MPDEGETILLRVLGRSPELEVIDVLADNPVLDLSVGEISEIAEMDASRVRGVLAKLESWNIVNVKSFEGQRRYSLDTSNDAVCHLLRFEFELAEQGLKGGSENG